MIALLVADTDLSVRSIEDTIEPYGFDVVRYRSPVKALDNIDELSPDAVFISTGDFPRHWKTIAQFVRSDAGKDKTVIVLLVNERFTADDADKACTIGVQAIVSESMNAGSDLPRLVDVFSRYRFVETRGLTRVRDAIAREMTFMFTNPLTDAIITGKLDSVSQQSVMFRPDAPSAVSELASGEALSDCTLRIGKREFQVECVVRKTGNFMIIDFAKASEELSGEIARVISPAV